MSMSFGVYPNGASLNDWRKNMASVTSSTAREQIRNGMAFRVLRPTSQLKTTFRILRATVNHLVAFRTNAGEDVVTYWHVLFAIMDGSIVLIKEKSHASVSEVRPEPVARVDDVVLQHGHSVLPVQTGRAALPKLRKGEGGGNHRVSRGQLQLPGHRVETRRPKSARRAASKESK